MLNGAQIKRPNGQEGTDGGGMISMAVQDGLVLE
jgi:hypothetical protein